MLVIYFSRLSDKEKAAIVESVDREFEAESKPKADNKMEQDEAKRKSASSKDERMNKLKAEKAEKVKKSGEEILSWEMPSLIYFSGSSWKWTMLSCALGTVGVDLSVILLFASSPRFVLLSPHSHVN